MDFADITLLSSIGLIGVCLYIGIYATLQMGTLTGGSYSHSLYSLVAAICVLISLIESFNLSSAIIQITWITISILGIIRLYLINKFTRFSVLELAFIGSKLPRFSSSQAKKLFQMGTWNYGKAGDVLTLQHKPVDYLYYLASGTADVFIDDKKFTTRISGDYIGEITYLSGAPATGTVVLSSSSTYFRVEVAAMRKLSKFNNPLHSEIEKSIADNLRQKLARNTDLSISPA